jgi:hypothetical protein
MGIQETPFFVVENTEMKIENHYGSLEGNFLLDQPRTFRRFRAEEISHSLNQSFSNQSFSMKAMKK